MTVDTLVRALASILRGEPERPDEAWLEPEPLREAIGEHGIGPLLADKLDGRGAPVWLEPLRLGLRTADAREALRAEIQRRELSRLLPFLVEEGVTPLVLKGAALAHTIYSRPGLRPCVDVDVFAPPSQLEPARKGLAGAGYAFHHRADGEECHVRQGEGGACSLIDLHTEFGAPAVAARDVPFEELHARSDGIAALGPQARTVDMVDAVVLAAIHYAHHHGRERLLWLWDAHLLVGVLGERELQEVVSRTQRARASAVCGVFLRETAQRFGSERVRILSREFGFPGPISLLWEPSASFVVSGLNATVRNAGSWREKRQVVRGLPWPAPEAMRKRPGPSFDQAPIRGNVRRLVRGLFLYVILGRAVSRVPVLRAAAAPEGRKGLPGSRKIRIVGSVVFWLAAVPLLERILGLRRLASLLTPFPDPARLRSPVEVSARAREIGRFLDSFLRVRLGRLSPPCWKRALVTYRLLRVDGLEAEVRFGVFQSEEGALKGHAWVRCAGHSWDAPKADRIRVAFVWPEPNPESQA